MMLRVVSVLAAAIAAAPAMAADACAPAGGLNFICNVPAAEDLVEVPKTNYLIASAMAAGGGINLVETRTKKVTNLYPGTGVVARHDKAKFGACPGVPDPKLVVLHGVALRPAANGHYTLYGVNHGGRESIEVFDIEMKAGVPTLAWTGCLVMPTGMAANSVSAWKDGTVIATIPSMPGVTPEDRKAGKPTGAVVQWTPGSPGFVPIPGTEMKGNNGIDTSPNDDEFFVVSYAERKVVAFSRTNPSKRLRETEVFSFSPDNVRWTTDGRVLSAGMAAPDPACSSTPNTPEYMKCPRGYVAISIDPKTMKITELASGPATPSFSGATMVVEMGNELWIGTYNNDKLAYRARR
jgi:hypothetical protein